MKKTLIIVFCITSFSALAQQQPPQPEKEFNLKLTTADISAISDALNEMPYKRSAPVMYKLQMQINTQMQAEKNDKPNEEKNN